MTETSQPASVSARDSSHTRRSNGTGRFSTRMRTRPPGAVRSPGEPDILAAKDVAFLDQAHQVDERLPVVHPPRNRTVRGMGVRDDDDLRPVDHLAGILAEDAIEVRDLRFEVLP